MLLRHHKEAKILLHKFRAIDPDRYERLTSDDAVILKNNTAKCQNLDELSFLTQFAFLLKIAGYEEIPQDIVKQCIKKSHKYDSIEVTQFLTYSLQ